MTTIRLLDARRGLNRKCEELFGDAKIAEAIYRYLCDGIEECEDAEPEPWKGEWVPVPNTRLVTCKCGFITDRLSDYNFCPNCGAKMEKGEEDV